MPPYAARQSMGRADKPLFVSGLLRIGAVQAEDAETTDKTAYPAPSRGKCPCQWSRKHSSDLKKQKTSPKTDAPFVRYGVFLYRTIRRKAPKVSGAKSALFCSIIF